MGSILVEDVSIAARRKESERQFHNDRFGAEHDIRQKLDKWYRAVAAGTEAQNALVRLHGFFAQAHAEIETRAWAALARTLGFAHPGRLYGASDARAPAGSAASSSPSSLSE